MQTEGSTLSLLRRLVFALVVIGLAGLTLDLLLLGHHEDAWQVAPLVALGLGLVACGWQGLKGSLASLRSFQCVMVLLALTGLVGMYLHFDGNREFQLEMDSSQSGWTLFLKVIQAHSPPALAPAAFVQFALLGLVSTFRHPALTSRPSAG
jgi:hypothetical protein